MTTMVASTQVCTWPWLLWWLPHRWAPGHDYYGGFHTGECLAMTTMVASTQVCTWPWLLWWLPHRCVPDHDYYGGFHTGEYLATTTVVTFTPALVTILSFVNIYLSKWTANAFAKICPSCFHSISSHFSEPDFYINFRKSSHYIQVYQNIIQ